MLSPLDNSDALSNALCVGIIILVRSEINKFFLTSIPCAATASHSLFNVTGSNTTPLPAKIYANEGVAQLLFLQADSNDICEVSYADRKGKYQGQTGVTLPKVL